MSKADEIKELEIHTKIIIEEGLDSDDDIQSILQKWLDLYQKVEEQNKDLWKAYLDASNDRDNNYIEKDKVKELFYKKRGLIEREDLQELLGGNYE